MWNNYGPPMLSAENLETWFNLLQQNIAPDWQVDKPYSINDLVLYDNKLYQANVNPTVGTWIANEWTKISMGELIQQVG